MSKPLVSVVISAHNASSFIDAALQSIFRQTLRDIEIIMIDDGSTDTTKDVIQRYLDIDKRLHLIENFKNMGLAHSLNEGFAVARGQYFCRLDADDISHPCRLEQQVTRFEQKPELLLLGTNATYVTENLRPLYPSRLPISDWDIRSASLLMNPFLHSSIMMRSEVFQVHKLRYNHSLKFAQDWDLWLRILDKGIGENLQERLVMIRTHPKSVSRVFQAEQTDCGLGIQKRYVKKMLGDHEWDEARYRGLYRGFLDKPKIDTERQINSVKSTCDALSILISTSKAYPNQNFRWLYGFILGRSLWVCIALVGQPGWRELLRKISGFQPKRIGLGVLWLIRFISTAALMRLMFRLRFSRASGTTMERFS